MKKILLGLSALLVLAVLVGQIADWRVEVLMFSAPIVVNWIRVKLSAAYRAKCDDTLHAITKH